MVTRFHLCTHSKHTLAYISIYSESCHFLLIYKIVFFPFHYISFAWLNLVKQLFVCAVCLLLLLLIYLGVFDMYNSMLIEMEWTEQEWNEYKKKLKWGLCNHKFCASDAQTRLPCWVATPERQRLFCCIHVERLTIGALKKAHTLWFDLHKMKILKSVRNTLSHAKEMQHMAYLHIMQLRVFYLLKQIATALFFCTLVNAKKKAVQTICSV